MTKAQLIEFVLNHARIGREQMIQQHGSFHQQVALVDRRDKLHLILIADDVLHGPKMRELLMVYSLSVGGADAILVQSDARMKAMKDEREKERVAKAAAEGRYIIANNPQAQEVFITCGRSREHVACIFDQYSRQPGNVIVFDTPQPELAEGNPEVFLIPNIWERVH